jgi:uncharacterized protein (UPF0262 family)
MSDAQRLIEVVLIYDLLENNHFAPVGNSGGPYRLRLGVVENRLIFNVVEQSGTPVTAVALPLSPIRKLMKDYAVICESYLAAIKSAPRSRVEAIDMGRRGLHDEGSEVLQSALAEQVVIDLETARRLFTLIYVLHMRA